MTISASIVGFAALAISVILLGLVIWFVVWTVHKLRVQAATLKRMESNGTAHDRVGDLS